ncbi:YceI family protein [Rhodovibrio salinarum]|uniref:Polyisoprenoid-binding protein n=1 Tax=Rhodovibrio salinarum TaxID=1087 RepID=A0A934QJK0_9PROT|nr:YceI family protein [Rhodovibrio salinarum]MBK1698074.1 polyisoprenoid-binding protein [Rhodovibrio salinarum]
MRQLRTLTLGAAGTAALVLATPLQAEAAPETFTVDPTHTQVAFLINHLGYSNMLGEFEEMSGEFTFDPEDASAAQVSLTIQADSVYTGHDKRDEHLTGPDFLNAQEFPEITFESTGVERTGEKTGKLTGDLTMHGQTHPVTLDVTFNKMAPNPLPQYDNVLTAGFSARGTIDRTKWGVDAYAPAVAAEMQLIIEVEGHDKDHEG